LKPQVLFSLIILIFGEHALAQNISSFFNGRQLYKFCESRMGRCETYVAGVADYMSELSAADPDMGLYCPPKGITLSQTVAIFKKFAQDNPRLLTNGAADIVGIALHKAYPCPSK
jgi:hypothetical protein